MIIVGCVVFFVMFLEVCFTLKYTVVKERYPIDVSGTMTSTTNSIGFLGGALIPTITGQVLDVYWAGETVAGTRVNTIIGYYAAFAIATAGSIIGFLVPSVLLSNGPCRPYQLTPTVRYADRQPLPLQQIDWL